MKKIIPALLILPFIFSCVLYSTPPLGKIDFPLKQVAKIPFESEIKGMAIGNTWIAVSTRNDKIIAVDIDTQKVLWKIDFPVISWSKCLFMDDDLLIAASSDRIIVIDKSGGKKEIQIGEDIKTIIEILEVKSGYIYVVGGSWVLEAYDYSRNVMLWKKKVGRGIVDVSYDPLDQLVYVTIDDTIYVDDNLTGEFLQKMTKLSRGHLVDGALYTLTNTDKSNAETHYEISAVDATTQKTLWQNSFILPANNYVGDFLIVGDLLVFSGDGMVAFDKSNGEQKWKIDVHTFGEEFKVPPVEFNDMIYAMGYASNTVFAISADDGSIIGTANLEEDNPFGVLYGEVFRLKDGILFNTSDAVVIYKNE